MTSFIEHQRETIHFRHSSTKPEIIPYQSQIPQSGSFYLFKADFKTLNRLFAVQWNQR
jgi:hypothetical protein